MDDRRRRGPVRANSKTKLTRKDPPEAVRRRRKARHSRPASNASAAKLLSVSANFGCPVTRSQVGLPWPEVSSLAQQAEEKLGYHASGSRESNLFSRLASLPMRCFNGVCCTYATPRTQRYQDSYTVLYKPSTRRHPLPR